MILAWGREVGGESKVKSACVTFAGWAILGQSYKRPLGAEGINPAGVAVAPGRTMEGGRQLRANHRPPWRGFNSAG